MLPQVVSRDDNVSGPSDRKAVRSRTPESRSHFFRRAIQQKGSDCFDGTHSHPSRGAGRENTVGKFLPQSPVGAFAPNLFKLHEPGSNLFSSRLMGGAYAFNCDWQVFAHYGLSIAGF